jgi:LysR family transcriptional regulator (chromosome initiation inhibitor)
VTAENVAVQGCRVERLGAMRYLAVAAPGLDPASGPMIVYNRKDRLQHRFLASRTHRSVDPPVHYVPSASAYVDAIRLGLGWGMVPERIALPDLQERRYVRLVADGYLDVPLYWQYWKIESTVLHDLTTAVKQAFSRWRAEPC